MSWGPPGYCVDDGGKVVGAVPPRLHNWGRWGDDDQRGTANLIGPAEVAAAARLVRTGTTYALGIPIDGQAPSHADRLSPTRLSTLSGSDYVAGFSLEAPAFVRHGKFTDDTLIVNLHSSTQWDGLGHVIEGETMYNGYWGGSSKAATGAVFNGIQHLRDGLVGRGVLLDVCGARGGAPLRPGEAITAADLDATAAGQDVKIEPGDILLVRTGHLGAWYRLDDLLLKSRDWFEAEPGLAVDTLEWLRDHDIAAVAADNWGVEVCPFEDPEGPTMPFHRTAIPGLGLTLGEYFWLDDLATACAADRRWEFLLAAQPLNLTNASASILNPIAIR